MTWGCTGFDRDLLKFGFRNYGVALCAVIPQRKITADNAEELNVVRALQRVPVAA